LSRSLGYFTVSPGPTIGNYTLVQNVIPNNGGLFVARNARDWLFNATDTLLLYVQPSDPKVDIELFTNRDSTYLVYRPRYYEMIHLMKML